MIDRTAVLQRVWELAEPVALAAGLELVDVQGPTERGRRILRLVVDRPGGGVTLDELARLSREVGDVLDAHDPVPWRYHLECSSPGVDRPLVREAHWRRATGERVHVRTREPVAGRRSFHGVLEGVDAQGVTLREDALGEIVVPFVAVERAHVEFDFQRALRASRAHG